MRLFSVSAAAALILTATATIAFADSAPITCSSRMEPLERAECLVRQHQQIMDLPITQYSKTSSTSSTGKIMTSSSSSSSHISSAPTVVSNSSSSVPAPSCSRAYGVQRALCLVEQRKAILKLLSTRPIATQMTQQPPSAIPSRKTCSRYNDRVIRTKCLNGQPFSLSSSSMSSSTMSSSSRGSSAMSSSVTSTSSSVASSSSTSSVSSASVGY